MADSKISALTALTGATIATNDELAIVDTSAVETKRITVTEFLTGILGSTSITGATVTTSQPLLNLAQTWNAGAVTFTGLKFNVTDTASAAASLLLDLQVSASSKALIEKSGNLAIAGDIYLGVAKNGPRFNAASTSTLDIFVSGTTQIARWNATALSIGGQYGLGSSAVSSDVFIGRNGAASTRLGAADAAAPVAQTFGVQSVVAGTSNTAGANFTIRGSTSTGSGDPGAILFQTGGTGAAATAQNSFVSAWAIAGGNQTLYPAGSLATNMTTGFLNIPGAAGIPSGTPANTTGFPLYYDSTNNKIYVYNGSWRSTAALT